MTHESLALLISAISLILSFFALGWNVYRDVILKPRLRVSFTVSRLFIPAGPSSKTVIDLSAVNHGPGIITCNTIIIKTTSWQRKLFRKQKWGVVVHDTTNPLSSQLPKKLEVGETIHLFLPYEKRSFLKDEFTHIGILDSFGHCHWASRKSVVDAMRSFRKNFNQVESDVNPASSGD